MTLNFGSVLGAGATSHVRVTWRKIDDDLWRAKMPVGYPRYAFVDKVGDTFRIYASRFPSGGPYNTGMTNATTLRAAKADSERWARRTG